MTELSNLEFLAKPGFSEMIMVKFLSSGEIIPFDLLDDNQVNILFMGMLSHRQLLKRCCSENDDRRVIVKRFIIKYWSAYDKVPDIDESGKFNFESYDERELIVALIKDINDQMCELERSITALTSRKIRLQFDISLLTSTQFES